MAAHTQPDCIRGCMNAKRKLPCNSSCPLPVHSLTPGGPDLAQAVSNSLHWAVCHGKLKPLWTLAANVTYRQGASPLLAQWMASGCWKHTFIFHFHDLELLPPASSHPAYVLREIKPRPGANNWATPLLPGRMFNVCKFLPSQSVHLLAVWLFLVSH